MQVTSDDPSIHSYTFFIWYKNGFATKSTCDRAYVHTF